MVRYYFWIRESFTNSAICVYIWLNNMELILESWLLLGLQW